MAVSALMLTLPHFLYPPYEFDSVLHGKTASFLTLFLPLRRTRRVPRSQAEVRLLLPSP